MLRSKITTTFVNLQNLRTQSLPWSPVAFTLPENWGNSVPNWFPNMGLAQTQGLETQRANKNWMFYDFYEVFGMHTVGNTHRNTHVWIQNGLSTVGFFGGSSPLHGACWCKAISSRSERTPSLCSAPWRDSTTCLVKTFISLMVEGKIGTKPKKELY